MSGLTRTPSPSSLSIGHLPCSSSSTVPQQHPGSPSPNRSAKTSVASSGGKSDAVDHPTGSNEKASTSTFSMGLGRLLFKSSSSGSKRDSIDSSRSDEAGRSPNGSRPTSPSSQPKSPQRSRSKRLANFASRSIRKHQWRLFKHRTFFGSIQRNSIKTKNQLQLPRLTLRHPSVDSAAMPFPIDVEEMMTRTTRSEEPTENEFLQIRRKNQRRWTDSDTTTRLRDSRDSSDFHDSHDTLDVVVGTSGSTVAAGSTGGAGGSGGSGGGGGGSDHHHSMTAPVSPNVPLSASSSHSDGWKYSSQKLLWKLKPRYINFSHASSTSSSTDSAWKSLDSMTWRSVDGAEVILRGARLENLSEIEKSALQVFAGQRLSKMLPGVNLGKQKDPLLFSTLRQKRQKLVKSNRAPTVADVQRRASGTPCPEGKRVFGVSLATCMMNEKRLDQESRCKSLDDSAVCLMNNTRSGKQVAKPVKSEPEIVSQPTSDDRKWLYPSTQNLYPSSSSNPSSPSPIMGPVCSIMPQSNHLLTAEPEVQQITGRFAKKTRPSSASFSCSLDASTDDVDPHALQVPRIVENCTQYLMTYGLNQVGLFRVAGNTKRCRQLRNALEKVGSGTAINDNMVENTTAHDVATLLKEYFRDLPQSLLPKENYQAYIAAAKLNIEDRIEAVRLLFALLESPNLDTIFVLMKFLHEVSTHWHDKYTPTGEVLQGNKMDARNLATIFAPSILRADHDKLHESLAENEQQITIVETMITNVEEIFRIPKELQCKIYTKLRETEPDRLDRILNYLSKMDSHDHSCCGMLSPFPATVEEDPTSPRVHHRHSHQDHSHIGRQSPLARELTTNGKVKVQSQRSGSWPFSLTRTQTSPNRNEHSQRFFPSDEESVNSTNPKDDSHHEDRRSKHLVKQYSKSASNTPSTSRRPTECQLKASTDDSGRESEYWPDELTVIEQTIETIEVEGRARAETVDGTTSSSSNLKGSKKNPNMATLAGTATSKSVDARSPSRERVDTFRTAARSSAAAARRRLRNVVRAFRWSSVARSTPDIAQTTN